MGFSKKIFILILFYSLLPIASAKITYTDLTTNRIIVENLEEEKNLLSQGCDIVHKLEDALVADCKNKDVQVKDAKKERIFLLNDIPASFPLPKGFQKTDLLDDIALRAPDVWDMGINGTNRIVALLDTGIDYNHVELADSFIGGFDFVNNDADPFDDIGHGTSTSGIITSNGDVEPLSKGIAPGAKILMVKVCGPNGCAEGDILAGLEFAKKGLDGIAKSGDEPDVISMSFGSLNTFVSSNCDRDILSKKINDVVRSRIPVVVAAGNSIFGVTSPSCSSKSIAAGSVGCFFEPFSSFSQTCVSWYDTLSSFSGRGFSMKHHGVLAPGSFVFTTIPDDGYDFLSGTSASAPYVAGLIALMKEKKPTLTPDQIKSIIKRSSIPINDGILSENTGFEIGAGRIDVLNTINNIR